MGLKCSLLGHAYEPADVEREREEQGSEVVTIVREIERCTRCGAERVVSESTEVTAVVDPEDVGLDEETPRADTESDGDAAAAEGAFDGVLERSEGADEEEAEDHTAEAAEADDDWSSVNEMPTAESTDEAESEFETRDPAEEDAEILTDDGEPERAPGQWPEDPDDEPWGPENDTEFETDSTASAEPETDESDEELSGITVPEGTLVCEDCGFQVDAESAYRDGDPCPECGSWLQLEGE
jgi:DNA-directed RNA polymerase subunit RPC12/RpoP